MTRTIFSHRRRVIRGSGRVATECMEILISYHADALVTVQYSSLPYGHDE